MADHHDGQQNIGFVHKTPVFVDRSTGTGSQEGGGRSEDVTSSGIHRGQTKKTRICFRSLNFRKDIHDPANFGRLRAALGGHLLCVLPTGFFFFRNFLKKVFLLHQ